MKQSWDEEENDYLQTNLNIENLKVATARENENLKKQYNDVLGVKAGLGIIFCY